MIAAPGHLGEQLEDDAEFSQDQKVLEEAVEIPLGVEAAAARSPRRSGRVAASLILSALVAAAVVASLLTRSESGAVAVRSGGAETPATTPGSDPAAIVAPVWASWKSGPCAAPTARSEGEEHREELVQQHAVFEAERALGWHHFRSRRPDGEWICGWIRADNPLQNPDAYLSAGGREPVYDAVNGQVMGYSYIYLGYFDREVADAPTFDPARLRVERHGCDPLVEQQTCKARPLL